MFRQPAILMPTCIYNKMSAAYFIVKFTNNKYEVSSAAYMYMYYSSHLAYSTTQKNILTGLTLIFKLHALHKTSESHWPDRSALMAYTRNTGSF